MQLEHCDSPDSRLKFKKMNSAETTPRNEWDYVITPKQCPPEQQGGGRKIREVDDLMKEKASVSAKLIRAEVIAVVLYTGPMVLVRLCSCCPYTCSALSLSHPTHARRHKLTAPQPCQLKPHLFR